ncbi:MAG: phosphoribosylanthranilate isomerase, partial [Dehalococcoidia bacterium]|nr:phosphoribosylanthranilate isomerase [Dehalococcoidia bacterium]
ALGFVFFARSPRQVTPELAAAIITRLPPFVAKVGVFVDEKLERVQGIMNLCSLDYAQLHGSESPEFCKALGQQRAIKAFRVKGEFILEQLSVYKVAAILLDSYNPDMFGGTGRIFNWEIAARAASSNCVILSGGLTPQNVSQAITMVKPYAVDVSSGVEASPGKKDHAKLKAFIQAAKGDI